MMPDPIIVKNSRLSGDVDVIQNIVEVVENKSYRDELFYNINDADTNEVKDRSINVTSLSSITVPDDFTDLIVRAHVVTSLPVTMPESITTIYGDAFPALSGEYIITISKIEEDEAYVRTIRLGVANA